MAGRRQLGLWLGAVFTLLFACGDDAGSSPRETPDAGNPEPKAAESKSNETVDAAPSSKATKSKPSAAMTTPKKGENEFFSADTRSSGSSSAKPRVITPPTAPSRDGATGDSGGPESESTRNPAAQNAVTRGDIFRVLDDKRILNLNTYRGVQILDVSDLTKPRIEGRLRVAGSPVEMYVLGKRALVLLNGWTGYYGSRDDVKIRAASGGLVMSIDIQDRANPKLIAQAEIKGDILTSRLTQGSDGQAALYVAGTFFDQQAHTTLKSFEVSSGELIAKSELDLGGQVQDIQATTDLMMVASADYTNRVETSTVTVIDISRTDGTMVKGGSVVAQGWVANKFNMDAYKGVLRIVSGAQSGGASKENRVETFSLSDLQNLKPIDSCKLTPRDPSQSPEQLFATVFIENRAFFVTYFRKDPFHAFSIDDAGHCQERTQFIVSGWNDFLRPAIDNTRLLGVGHNDENNGRLLSVSLYDAVNLDNATPLLARADIELDGAYSEAVWDDRAFSVLENTVSVRAADGTQETGLLLLPFSGWDFATQSHIGKVQVFTFSNRTLTKRGTMDHGSSVRRTFDVQTGTTANLSHEVLSLFDTSDLDQPRELGRLDIAPSHSRLFVYGEYVARLRDNVGFSYVPGQKLPQSKMQIVSAAGDIETNPVLASFDVPIGTTLTQVGQLLVTVFSEQPLDELNQHTKINSQIQVWDLSDPLKPQQRAAFETDQLDPFDFYPSGPDIVVDPACLDCIRAFPSAPSTSYVVGAAMVFTSTKPQQESQGFVTQCDTYPGERACSVNPEGNWRCENPYYAGGITCITPDGGQESCSGQFYTCDEKTYVCNASEPPASTNRSCAHYEQFRYWTSYGFDALDLRNPDKPTIAKRVELPTDEAGTSIVAIGDTVYYNFQQPFKVPGDDRNYVKHYVRRLGFADPQKADVGTPINIPGDVMTATDTTLYARDFIWKDQDERTMIARLDLEGDKAKLQASKVFEDRQVSTVKLDGSGHILVNTDPVYDPATATQPPKSKLSILNDQDLSVIGEAEIDDWAILTDAKHGLALYQVPAGLLVIDVKDAAKPKAQAYFPLMDWPMDIVFDGDAILFAAGYYGVYKLDAGAFNLLMP